MTARGLYVGLSGNIGVGKSALTRVLAGRLGWEAFYEPVLANPYLEDFYADMKRYAFHLQIYFLSQRFRAMQRCLARGGSFLQDRTLYEDGEVFAPTLRDMGMLTQRDFENYHALFEAMLGTVRPPDGILFLVAPTEVLLARIRRRDRPYERHIDGAYLEMLERRYEDWIGRISGTVAVRRIDTSDLDLEGSDGKLDSLVSELAAWAGRPR